MDVLLDYRGLLLQGLLTTLLVTVLGTALALVVAVLTGIGRASARRWVSIPSAIFIEVFRGTSLVVQMFWLFYVLPFAGIEITPLTAAVLALGFNEGAYGAEVVRGALSSIDKGQREACVALSLTGRQTLWRILIPQAIPIMLPSFGNVLIDLFKNTSLVSLVTVAELTFIGQQVRTTTGQTLTVYLFLMVVYFLVSSALGWLVRRLERVVDRRITRGTPLDGPGDLARAGASAR